MTVDASKLDWTSGSVALAIWCGSCGTSVRNASELYPLSRNAPFPIVFRLRVIRVTLKRPFLFQLLLGVICMRVTRRTAAQRVASVSSPSLEHLLYG